MGVRHDRVVSALKREISNIVHDELKDSQLGFVTIIRITLTADLRNAQVYFSVLGQKKEQEATQKVLDRAKPFIRNLIGKRMNFLKFVPDLTFKLDQSAEYSIKIQKELDKIKEQYEHEKTN